MNDHQAIYIDGGWVRSTGTDAIDVMDPSTEQVIGRVPAGAREDVDRAVQAASAALPGWSSTPLDERVDILHQISGAIKSHEDELAELISREVGTPLALSKRLQAGVPSMTFASIAELVGKVSFTEQVAKALVVKEPIGVVSAITPWNFPLHQIALKVAPALAVGCTIVVKPSEVAPLAAYRLAELIDDLGLPPGVFNLVSGSGRVVGEAMAAHPDVMMVTFTGSTVAGRRVSELASGTIKRVTLELGGKGCLVILDDVEDDQFERAVVSSVARCYNNSGQTCAALTRLLVPASRLVEAEEIARREAATFTLGDPGDPDTRLGPLVSATQRERVRTYIEKGISEGAALVAGGAEAPSDLPVGYYVKPTVFSRVTAEMTINREEIFGPVLSILPYGDEAEGIEIANSTQYGLTSSVWAADVDRATSVARSLRVGMVDVNGGSGHYLELPFGGVKQSGNGREFGVYGIGEYLELKALNVAL